MWVLDCEDSNEHWLHIYGLQYIVCGCTIGECHLLILLLKGCGLIICFKAFFMSHWERFLTWRLIWEWRTFTMFNIEVLDFHIEFCSNFHSVWRISNEELNWFSKETIVGKTWLFQIFYHADADISSFLVGGETWNGCIPAQHIRWKYEQTQAVPGT